MARLCHGQRKEVRPAQRKRRIRAQEEERSVTAEGIQPLAPTGARKLHARTAFFYGFTGHHAGHVHAPDRRWFPVRVGFHRC